MSEPTVRFFVFLSHVLFLPLLLLLVIIGVATFLVRRKLVRAQGPYPGPVRTISGTAGVILYTPLALNLILLSLSFLHIGCAALVAKKWECMSHLKVLAQAELLYAQDYDDRLPLTSRWAEAIESRVRRATTPEIKGDPFRCPAAESPGSYGMNNHLDGVPIAKLEVPAMTVLLFDADAPIRSFAGDALNLARKRHGSVPNAAFADGHAKGLNQYYQQQLNWAPTETIGRQPFYR